MSTWIERLGWVLVHSLWQFALLSAIAFGLQRTMQRASSSARYLVLLGMLAAIVAAPLVTWSVLPGKTPPPVIAASPAPVPQPPCPSSCRRHRGRSEPSFVVDDSPEKHICHSGNLIRVKPFLGDPVDQELLALLPDPKSIRGEANDRSMGKRIWRQVASRLQPGE